MIGGIRIQKMNCDICRYIGVSSNYLLYSYSKFQLSAEWRKLS